MGQRAASSVRANLAPDVDAPGSSPGGRCPAEVAVRVPPWLAAAVVLLLLATTAVAADVVAVAQGGFVTALASTVLPVLILVHRREIAEVRSETAARCLHGMDHLVVSASVVNGARRDHAAAPCIRGGAVLA